MKGIVGACKLWFADILFWSAAVRGFCLFANLSQTAVSRGPGCRAWRGSGCGCSAATVLRAGCAGPAGATLPARAAGAVWAGL